MYLNNTKALVAKTNKIKQYVLLFQTQQNIRLQLKTKRQQLINRLCTINL